MILQTYAINKVLNTCHIFRRLDLGVQKTARSLTLVLCLIHNNVINILN